MGGPVFDRQVFVKKKDAKPQVSRHLLPGGLALVVVAALSAFATYRFVKAGGASPSNAADKAQIKELQTQLKQTQALVDELQSRRHRRHATEESKSAVSKGDAPEARSTRLAGTMAHPPKKAAAQADPSVKASAATEQPLNNKPAAADAARTTPATASSAPTGAPRAAAAQAAPVKELSALQGNLQANHEEWQATVNRLGNVVGELDSQRNALQKTQTGVNYLLERVQSSDVPFTLKRGSGLQHVGPISMELASTSVKGQHYSVRMVVDDKSVELKDRALNEVVQFYTSRSQYPLRLIISQINREQVSGTLAVPSGLEQESASHQLQER